MINMKIVIVGGVAGGASAAARLRRLDENAEIIILEKSGYISYANCGLPYYIGKKIQNRESLTLQTPNSFFKRFRIDVRVNNEVLSIDKDNKLVKVRNLKTEEEYFESYDKLILSPGARPIIPNIKGIESSRVFTIRTVEDTYKIFDYIEKFNPKKAAIIGAGFIGLEMAENLYERGLEVDIIQKDMSVMPNLDYDMAQILQCYIIEKGIELHLNANTKEIVENSNLLIKLEDGKQISADMIILAVGVLPDSRLAMNAKLELGIKGAIRTSSTMEASNDIYAVGDAVMVKHMVTKNDSVISLAGPANRQGRIAANNICGIHSEYKGSLGSSILKMFDMTVSSTGLNKRMCDDLKIDYDYVIISHASHATYYPGSTNMYIKVYFEKTSGQILGGQIVGFEGVDKRIDVLATAIKFNATAYDLCDLDLAYAPPFSSAKDPINMVGLVITNILTGIVKQVHWEEVLDNKDAIILDTRTKQEYSSGHIDGALHIPVDELRENIEKIPTGHKIYVYCHSGLRSYIACRILMANGFDCYNVSGGFGFYQNILLSAKLVKKGLGLCGLEQ